MKLVTQKMDKKKYVKNKVRTLQDLKCYTASTPCKL